MLPDIWSNSSAREPEFSNCGIGTFVASEMKHKKVVNRDNCNKLSVTRNSVQKIPLSSQWIFRAFQEDTLQLNSKWLRQNLSNLLCPLCFFGVRKGKQGRQIYQAYIRACEGAVAQMSQRRDTTDRLILDYFLWTAKCFKITCIWL